MDSGERPGEDCGEGTAEVPVGDGRGATARPGDASR